MMMLPAACRFFLIFAKRSYIPERCGNGILKRRILLEFFFEIIFLLFSSKRDSVLIKAFAKFNK